MEVQDNAKQHKVQQGSGLERSDNVVGSSACLDKENRHQSILLSQYSKAHRARQKPHLKGIQANYRIDALAASIRAAPTSLSLIRAFVSAPFMVNTIGYAHPS
jgi:hypothetical protein